MPRNNRTDFAVLGFLSRQSMTAYEIKTRLERGATHHFWRESFGQLYPALKRMEDAGLVQGEDDPTEGGRRRPGVRDYRSGHGGVCRMVGRVACAGTG